MAQAAREGSNKRPHLPSHTHQDTEKGSSQDGTRYPTSETRNQSTEEMPALTTRSSHHRRVQQYSFSSLLPSQGRALPVYRVTADGGRHPLESDRELQRRHARDSGSCLLQTDSSRSLHSPPTRHPPQRPQAGQHPAHGGLLPLPAGG